MQNDTKPVENVDVCTLVLKDKGKPEGYLMCKAINVFDNRYRVNIYTKRTIEGIEGRTISQSYFVKYAKDTITYLS